MLVLVSLDVHSQSPGSPDPWLFAPPGKYQLTDKAKARKTDYYQIGDLSLHYGSNTPYPGFYYPATQWHEPGIFYIAPSNIAVGDFNGDGLQDAAVAWSIFPHTVKKAPYPVTILLNDGKGGLAHSQDIFIPGSQSPKRLMHYRILVADFNGDKVNDIVIGSFGIVERDKDGNFSETNEPLSLILSDGHGKLFDASAFIEGQENGGIPEGYHWAHDLAVGDVNGDGSPDFLAGGMLFLNNGQGRFRNATSDLHPSIRRPFLTMSSAMGDLDGDGVDDIVALQFEGPGKRNFAYLSGGGRSIRAFRQVSLPDGLFGSENTKSNYCVVTDLNGDGWKDILIGETRAEPYYDGRVLQVLINQGNGEFRDESDRITGDDRFPGGGGEGTIYVVDVNADGYPDIVDTSGDSDSITNYEQGPRLAAVFLNDGAGHFAAIPEREIPDLTQGDLRGFENLDYWYADRRYPNLVPIKLGSHGALDWISSFRVPMLRWPMEPGDWNEFHLYTIKALRPYAQSPPAVAYTISGNAGVAGATVTISGSITATTTSDPVGAYSFPNLPAGGNYAVTPTLPGYLFTPVNRTFVALSANQVWNFAAMKLPATLSLDRTRLNFAARSSAALTPLQKVLLSFSGGGSPTWTAVSNQPWLQVTPASGTGSTRLTVSIVPGALPSVGTANANVTITAPGATNPTRTLPVLLKVLASSGAPYGSFDTPPNNATKVAGSIAVTGWAIDDIAVSSVRIYRDKIGNEAVQPNGFVYIGDATFVPNSRTDIEGLNPTLPASYRAGWGYLMLTNPVPNPGGPQGNGTIKLWAIATDIEGNTTNLGSKTITLDNATSKLPFGAIDNPSQGGIAIGTVNNSGWIMTPPPNTMAAAPASISVYIDGAPAGNVTYGQARPDVAGLFPNFRNSAAPGANFILDTTQYSNAMHSVHWVAYDNAGNGDGIGSRFFFIENGLSAGVANPAPPMLAEDTVPAAASRSPRPRPQRGAVPQVRKAQELERLVIDLPEGAWTGAHIVNGEPQPLPVGSTLDNANGAFYWHLGPGFLGRHELLFTSSDGAAYGLAVNIEPRAFPAARQE